jgi:putative ATPase
MSPVPRAPLAERLRPTRLEEVVGQERLLAPGGFLAAALEHGDLPSLVLWGPPGSGKTTLARLMARASGAELVPLSAVTSGVKEVREVIAHAREQRRLGTRTVLFVDEIHRFHKGQQDAFLPHVEDGTIVLVGATTENPGFALTGALLSRVRVLALEPLGPEALDRILERALADPERGLGGRVRLLPEARAALREAAGGDARRLLGVLEGAVHVAAARAGAGGGGTGGAASPGPGELTIGPGEVREAAQQTLRAYDASGDDRYDLLSALHKSLRGSHVDAALFWLGRLLEGGEDGRVIARRLVAMASEDVGLADPTALTIAVAALKAWEFLGPPEGELALAQAVVHLATAPKSNSVVEALGAAREAARLHAALGVPPHLRNAPTAFARSLGHAEGYRYPHDHPLAFVAQAYLPPEIADLTLYRPHELGQERETARRAAWWRKRFADGGDRV